MFNSMSVPSTPALRKILDTPRPKAFNIRVIVVYPQPGEFKEKGR
jgi:hypothetical protein